MWATDQYYDIVGVRVRIHCTSTALAAHVAAALGRFAVLGDGPSQSDVCYNLVAGKEPTRRGQRGFHFLYLETSRLRRTTLVSELIAGLVDDLAARLPGLLPDPDVYALIIGIVMRGDAAVLLAGATPVATRRLVAAFCARGYDYASSTTLYLDSADRSWFPCSLPLVCADADEAAGLRTLGIAFPGADGPGDAYPLVAELPPADATRSTAHTTSASLRRPAMAIRALVVETPTSDGAGAVEPLGRTRAVMRLLERSANFQGRAAERPALVRDVLAHAAMFEVRRPERAGTAHVGDELAVRAVDRTLE